MRRLLPALALFLTPAWALGQSAGADPALGSKIREALQPFVDRGEITGAVGMVGDKDRILALEAVGKAGLSPDRPMRPDSVFRIASMTKPTTAIAVMMLVDAGKIGLDDPLEKHLPEFRGQKLVASKNEQETVLKKPARPITVRDLLTHTSGLPGSPPLGLADLYAKRQRTLAEAVMAYSQNPLDFEPGSKWSYCNTGIDTLGRLVEAVAGQDYEQFLKERLTAPLGMVDTTFYPTADQLARTATTCNVKDGQLVAVDNPLIGPPAGAKYPIPAGGLYATAPDLAKLYAMLLGRGQAGDHRYLSESALAEMTKLQTGDLKAGFVDGMGFGLGVGYVREPQGVTADLSPGSYGHGGAFGTQAWIDPTVGRYYVLMIQRTGLPNADASDMRRALQHAGRGR